jgi:hypothetical protein
MATRNYTGDVDPVGNGTHAGFVEAGLTVSNSNTIYGGKSCTYSILSKWDRLMICFNQGMHNCKPSAELSV